MEQPYRRYILDRDYNSCVICGAFEQLHIHHIKTRGSGGDDSYHNLITLCHQCHTEKAHGKHSKYYRKFFLEYTMQYDVPDDWFDEIIIPTSIQRSSSVKASRKRNQSAYKKQVEQFKESHNGLSPSQVAYRNQEAYLKNKQSLDNSEQ